MPAGDVTKALRDNVRTLLDEVVSSDTGAFWKNSEIYTALNNAQKEVVKFLFKKYLSEGILSETLRSLATGPGLFNVSNGEATLPANFLYALAVRYKPDGSNFRGATRVGKSREFWSRFSDNTYSKPTTSDPVYYIEEGKLKFLPTATVTNGVELTYIKEPDTAGDSTDPEIAVSAHKLLVLYAASEVLNKERVPEALNQSAALYKQFQEELNLL